ncbi:phage holin family protein [Cnuibacter sp. UC19_7]|uniref:phage holin family protein n=1 Tax=Cnuibacter sp. UC19_7 TaxID=3350166 RepID=UPI0036719A6E
MTEERDRRARRSLGSLIADVPTLIVKLLKDELENIKRELTKRLASLGIGIGLLVFAGLLAFFLLAVLITAAVLGLATVFPPWLAALLTAAGLLIIIIVLALVGLSSVKKGMPPVPKEAVESLKKDVNVVKGLGQS